METTSPILVGVKVVLCEGNKQKEEWIDMSKVQAIAWDSGEIDHRGKPDYNPNKKLPTLANPPIIVCASSDPSGTGEAGGGVCWWTGSAWVCGDA